MSNLDISRAQRLDHYVIDVLPQLSRGDASKLIADQKVSVNGQPVVKPGYKLRRGDKITIDFNNDDYERIPDVDVPIIYEDDDVIVLNKPAGLLTHSKGAFNPEATVASFVRSRLQIQKKIQEHKNSHLEVRPLNVSKDGIVGLRAGIVHRLDRATSGVIICAKTLEALTWLQKQFADRKVKKTYYAIIDGTLDPAHAIIDMPIERNPKKPQTFRAGHGGKSAQTEYEIIKNDNGLSLVKLSPRTGRTHQLRVHLSQLGHPIVGDELYGGRLAERLFLHAESLEIILPNHERQTFVADLPDEFNGVFTRP